MVLLYDIGYIISYRLYGTMWLIWYQLYSNFAVPVKCIFSLSETTQCILYYFKCYVLNFEFYVSHTFSYLVPLISPIGKSLKLSASKILIIFENAGFWRIFAIKWLIFLGKRAISDWKFSTFFQNSACAYIDQKP